MPKPANPLIALTPPELMESDTTPRDQAKDFFGVKSVSGRRLLSANSAKSARSFTEYTTQNKSVHSSDKYLSRKLSEHSPGLTPSPSSGNVTARKIVEHEDSTLAGAATRSENGLTKDLHQPDALVQVSEHITEEDEYHTSNLELTSLLRPSIANSGNLRSRIRHMSLCFRRDAPPTTLSDHYVVCGIPSNYEDFLANLSDLNEKVAGLIFITQRTLQEKDLRAHQLHERLYFVRGSPLSMHVFHTARILYARSILIMSYCGMENTNSVDGENDQEGMDENMADVDAITTHRFISEALQNEASRLQLNRTRPTPFIVAEMIRPSNVKFLIDRNGSLFDAKAAANEPHQRDLLKDVKFLDSSFYSPLYASGHIYFSNIMDALMGSCANQQLMIEMVTQLVISGNMSMKMPNRVQRSRHRLSQIPAPERYHFRPYALLVEGLLQNENTMTLGIYRSASTAYSPQHVLTNPPGDELVSPHDLLFVIK
ncbi:voltage-gated ion channel superfamily [Plasmopara halstedii]|uniref:Voltage-gated ion channel superfamily n=1 Tax=Plasmopara halstedii TaxID=4781 RepID=A0A0P1A4Z7_PLAHL|nr:voltage-gated ion channel superfamily [Plasmopara halstedii]CEG35244.1 voltage-gated ion channel superfamily [Plasmopara halstedii]|eukprot:XP_024571613.1 voltage-gated ion channel superfamily [Plasmopara halstedii]